MTKVTFHNQRAIKETLFSKGVVDSNPRLNHTIVILVAQQFGNKQFNQSTIDATLREIIYNLEYPTPSSDFWGNIINTLKNSLVKCVK